MAGRAIPPNGTIYRVVNLGTATIVEDGIRDEEKARERLSRELGWVPEGASRSKFGPLPAKNGSSSGPSEASRGRAAFSNILAEPET
jgi:hypothetical protein